MAGSRLLMRFCRPFEYDMVSFIIFFAHHTSVVTDAPSITALSYVGLQVFSHSHGRWRTHIPEETVQLQPNLHCYPPKNLLLLLRLTVQSNQTWLVEVSSEDIEEFS